MKTFQFFSYLLCGGIALLASCDTCMAQRGGDAVGESRRGTMSASRPSVSRPSSMGASRPSASRPSSMGESRPSVSRPSSMGESRPGISRPSSMGESRPGTTSTGRPGSLGENHLGIDRWPTISRPGNRPSGNHTRPNLPGQSPSIHPSDRGPSGHGGADRRPVDKPMNHPEINPMNDRLHEAGRHMDPDRFVDRGPHFHPDPHHGPDFYRPGHPGYWDRHAYRPASHWVVWADTVRVGLSIGVDTYHAYRWYNDEWWGYHPPVVMPWWHYHRCWDRYPSYYWWQAPSWSGVVAWFPSYGWNEPVYYEYGTDGNVIYQDNRVFVNGQDVGTIDTYRESAAELAVPSLPEPKLSVDAVLQEDADTEWLALGTFAMVTDQDAKVDPDHCFALQLAVNQDGLLSGTFCDPDQPDQTFSVQGRVDEKTQRVAFTIDGLDDTVFESGIYNLTQDETPLLVHDETRTLKSYLLVRLDDPNAEKTESTSAVTGTTRTSQNTGNQRAILPLIGPK